MDLTAGIVFLIIGIAIGAFAGIQLSKAKMQTLVAQARAENERLKQANTELSSMKAVSSERIAVVESQLRTVGEQRDDLQTKLDNAVQSKADLETKNGKLTTTLEMEREQSKEKIKLLESFDVRLKETFQALSQDALGRNNELFTNQATQVLNTILATAKGDFNVSKEQIEKLVQPIQDSLKRFDENTRAIEENRIRDTSSLVTQIKGFEDARRVLETKTTELVNALKADPRKWGSWGEMQLRRVIEIAGMEKYCDFEEQVVVKQEGGRARPDVIVKLPNHKSIVIDAKAALDAYTASFQAKDETERVECLKRHSENIRIHITSLSKRKYDDIVEGSLDFVVMFVPGESVLASALDAAPDLLDFGANNRVLLATPVTLIGLLRAVAYGWREEEIARNAKLISEQGKEIYERLCKFLEHFIGIKRGLDTAVGSYNDAVGSLERRLLPSGRRMKELDSGIKEDLPGLNEIDITLTTRALSAPEAGAQAED
jgi:DNA recombination protein RmuC